MASFFLYYIINLNQEENVSLKAFKVGTLIYFELLLLDFFFV